MAKRHTLIVNFATTAEFERVKAVLESEGFTPAMVDSVVALLVEKDNGKQNGLPFPVTLGGNYE